VIVVDPPGAPRSPRDRIFLISWWGSEDSTADAEASAGSTLVINGLSWPHTERFEVLQRDSLHWRWVSMTVAAHPMHLHGFYFRVDGKGDGARYTTYTPQERRSAVTEVLRPGETMAIAWSPTKPGNWIFHCHVARHMSPASEPNPERTALGTNGSTHASHDSHQHQMASLVLGIRVKPRGEQPQSTRDPRAIRLLIRSRPTPDGDFVRYSYVLGASPEESDGAALPVPGPTLVLEKDEPVAITLVNRSHEPAAVHWHGIELESFPDGVPGWSGYGTNVLPSIPSGDSITVRFTPPRAGTFMYHSHFNEMQQIASGLYGAILVLNRGHRYDPETDRVLLFSDPKPASNDLRRPLAAVLNGRAQPDPIELRAGVTYRFRVINIRSNAPVTLTLLDGEQPAEWRQVAKDGADLPATQAATRPAQLTFGPGEIYDYEFTPRAPGDLTLRFGFPPPRIRRPDVVIPDPVVVAVRVR
jgi:FtsP/CotA-like multicopper oxidase with cupredoxin domain